jgi:hypothetical protein
MTDITEIMRDKAQGKKTELGDHWADSWCSEAAFYIDELRSKMHVVHMDTEILFTGTKEECQAHKDKQKFNTYCWKVHSLEEYGQACYNDGIEMADATRQ